jgi:chromate transporter
MPVLLDLFLTYNRIGALTFGGGYAMLPMLQREIVNRGWITEEELMNWYALSQCAPGIIAANMATFVGYKKRGSLGGIVATLGVVFPSLVVIIIVAAVLQKFSDLPLV